MHAIVIEDELALQFFYQFVLEKAGLVVTTFLDGKEALNVLQAVPAPAVVILDMLLPGLDGEHILDYIQHDERFKETVVLIISAHERFSALAKDNPQVRFLLKPVRPSQITDVIQQVAQTHL